jgi:hypothetical protein
MSDAGYIATEPLSDISPEQARATRARAWVYVFECWHARRGDSHDLTTSSNAETAENGLRKTEQENT